jgi:hypothetical protein
VIARPGLSNFSIKVPYSSRIPTFGRGWPWDVRQEDYPSLSGMKLVWSLRWTNIHIGFIPLRDIGTPFWETTFSSTRPCVAFVLSPVIIFAQSEYWGPERWKVKHLPLKHTSLPKLATSPSHNARNSQLPLPESYNQTQINQGALDYESASQWHQSISNKWYWRSPTVKPDSSDTPVSAHRWNEGAIQLQFK